MSHKLKVVTSPGSAKADKLRERSHALTAFALVVLRRLTVCCS